MTPCTRAQLDAYRGRLVQERAEIIAQSKVADADTAPVSLDQQSVGRLSRMDALQVQAMAKALAVRRRAALQQIEAALKRLDAEEFGYCTACGEPIAGKRLALDPKTALCVDCAC